MDEVTAKNREALYAWYARRNAFRQGLVVFQSPWPRMHMAVLDREYLEKRLAARRWLAANSPDIIKYVHANIVDISAFARKRRGY